MRVLICIPCLLTGGTEIQTLSLVKALMTVGHEVTTVCYFEHTADMVERFQQAGSRVVCLSADGSRTVGLWATITFLYRGLKQIVKKMKPDVAHVQYMAPGAIPIILLRLLGIKTIIATAHTAADIYPSLRLLRFIQRHLLTAFTCITERAERSFFGTSHLYSPTTVLARKGNHFTIYNNLPNYIQIATTPKHFRQPMTIGVVSRLERIKGMDLVVPAFYLVHKKYTDTRLLVVGDGSLRPQMEQQVHGCGLSDAVQFVGRQSQEVLQSYYDKIDILLMPSRSEGFGLTAIEGMARGCVVVAANVGGLPEVIRDGETGLLHKVGQPEDMANKLLSLLESTDLVSSMSSKANARVRTYSTERYNKLIDSLYSKIKKEI